MPSFASREQGYNFYIHWKALLFEFEWIQASTEAATCQPISQNAVFFVVFQFVWLLHSVILLICVCVCVCCVYQNPRMTTAQNKCRPGRNWRRSCFISRVCTRSTHPSVLLINSTHQTEYQCEMCIDKFNMVPLKNDLNKSRSYFNTLECHTSSTPHTILRLWVHKQPVQHLPGCLSRVMQLAPSAGTEWIIM